jgi:hypothetical protein
MIFINQNFSQWLELSLTGSLYTEFRVGTSTSTAIVVDWGDGSTSSYSGTLMTISHTYSSAFTGNMKISCSAGNNLINRLDNFSASNTYNSITFTTTQIGTFAGLSIFNCSYTNAISGSIEYLPSTLTYFSCKGGNATSGDIALLPSGLTYYVNLGFNTTFGDIGSLPINLTYFVNNGSNITSGNIGSLPISLQVYDNQGSNTTTGGVNTLPATLTSYRNFGSNMTSGNINALPTSLQVYDNKGSNTTTGDMYYLPIEMTFYVNTGLNTVVDYTSGRVWANNMIYVSNLPTLASGGLSSTEVDNLLIDLALVPTWNNTNPEYINTITLSGNNAPRTVASDAAVVTLIAKPVIVSTN